MIDILNTAFQLTKTFTLMFSDNLFYLDNVQWGSKPWEILHITRQVIYSTVNFSLLLSEARVFLPLPFSMLLVLNFTK
jgi:hypothetical protein